MITQRLKAFFETRGFVLGGDLNKNDRAGALHKAWGHIFTNHIFGDYVEFGVYHGASFVESYKQYKAFERWLQGQLFSHEDWRRTVAQRYSGHKVHFHGLDTFSGMPENGEGNLTFVAGTYAASHSAVIAKCLRAGMPAEAFSLYEGLFSETAPALSQRLSQKIAIANIDCDIYVSAVDALNAIRQRLQLGCVLMFDDYNAYCADNCQGERRAFREFCDTVPFIFEPWFTYQYSGQAFLCVEVL
jgi:O-methyltransferase